MSLIQTTEALFIRNDNLEPYEDYVVEDKFFAIFSIQESGEKIKRNIRSVFQQAFRTQNRLDLRTFKSVIEDVLQELDLKEELSLACGFLQDNIFYFKTTQQGEVYIYRDGHTHMLIQGDNEASGYVKDNDIFVFTNTNFNKLLANHYYKLNNIFRDADPIATVQNLEKKFDHINDINTVSLFVACKQSEASLSRAYDVQDADARHDGADYGNNESEDIIEATNWATNLIINFQKYKKLLIVFGLILLGVIFVWNVMLANERKVEADRQQKINLVKEIVTKKIAEAEALILIKPKDAADKIKNAEAEIDALSKEIGIYKPVAIEELRNLIGDYQRRVSRREEKNAEVFYDLAVDNQKAKGDDLAIYGDKIHILDSKQGIVYLFSLKNKSLDSYKHERLKDAKFITAYKDSIFVFVKNKGVYRVGADDMNLVIKADKDWGDIVAIDNFYGNIYLLDKRKNMIHRYTVIDSGYTDRVDYFQPGESQDLGQANSLGIDGSIYIGLKNNILKYTKGVREAFVLTLPEESIEISRIYTDGLTERVYIVSRTNSAIYIINKSGSYEKQIYASVIRDLDDIFVYDEAIYLLVDNQILKFNE